MTLLKSTSTLYIFITFITITLFCTYKPFIQQTRFYVYTSIGKTSTQNESPCYNIINDNNIQFLNESKINTNTDLRQQHPIYLFSNAGSGTTMTRVLLENVTGVWTGFFNPYNEELFNNFLIVKAHPEYKKEIFKQFKRHNKLNESLSAIFLIGNPWRSIFEEFKLMQFNKTVNDRYVYSRNVLLLENWNKTEWAQFIMKATENWLQTFKLMQTMNFSNYVIIQYEKLTKKMNSKNSNIAINEMKKILKYIYSDIYYTQIKDILTHRMQCIFPFNKITPNPKTHLTFDNAFAYLITHHLDIICDAWNKMKHFASIFSYQNILHPIVEAQCARVYISDSDMSLDIVYVWSNITNNDYVERKSKAIDFLIQKRNAGNNFGNSLLNYGNSPILNNAFDDELHAEVELQRSIESLHKYGNKVIGNIYIVGEYINTNISTSVHVIDSNKLIVKCMKQYLEQFNVFPVNIDHLKNYGSFNRHAIYLCLHKIHNLSTIFIQSSNDFLLTSDNIHVSDFYNLKLKSNDECNYIYGERYPSLYNKPRVWNKTQIKNLWVVYPMQFLNTLNHIFPSEQDIDLTSLYPIFQQCEYNISFNHNEYSSETETEIETKKAMQNEFFNSITTLQRNCSNDRLLILNLFGTGFANIHHHIGLSLLLSVATNRRLFIVGNFMYFNSNCTYFTHSNWQCVHNSITDCALDSQIEIYPKNEYYSSIPGSMFEYYYHTNPKVTYMNYNVSRRRIVNIFFRSGIFKHEWLETFPGNMWIRSHIQYYLWTTLNTKSKQILDNMPIVRKLDGENYIAFHIRKTDNVKNVKRGFGVNTTKSLSVSHYMSIANKIRDDYDTKIQTIYVCTDNEDVINGIKNMSADGWNFIYNEQSERSSTNVTYEWFSKGDHLSRNNNQAMWNIIMDIELLRKADFLVGSSTSNVFRLATELHFATNWPKKRTNKQTVHSIDDIPWFQDP